MHSPLTAADLLRKLFISRPEDIDLEAIAWLQGAKVKYRELDGCEACIVGRADVGRAIISIDKHGNPRRQRFSLAHEIGHWELHRGRILVCQKQDIGGSGRRRQPQWQEGAANRFAAELLMPEAMVTDALRDFRKFDMYVVRQLADAFNVSQTAMAYRLVEMDYVPSLLVAHGKKGRRWFLASRSIDSRWFPKQMLDPDSSAYRILHQDAPDDRFMSTIEADTWFDVPWAGEIQLKEQSFSVGHGEVVTLLVAGDERMLSH